MSEQEPGMKELLQALVQVGRIAEAMLARREAGEREPRPAEAQTSARPSEWRDHVPAPPRQFFTKHAGERLHERYGVPLANTVSTMAALSHQIRGTHFAGIEGVNLGRRPASDGVNGTIWAVDLFREVGFVVVDDDGVIVTALPRDTKQLQQMTGPQRAALDAFRTELQIRHAAPLK